MKQILKNWFKRNRKTFCYFLAGIFLWILVKENLLNLSYPAWGYLLFGGIDFDGIDDFVLVPHFVANTRLSFGDLFTDDPFSASCWVFIREANQFEIFKKAGQGATRREYSFDTTGAGLLQVVFYDNVGNVQIKATSNVALTGDENTSIHLGFTYDGSGSENGITLYRNGLVFASTPSMVGAYTAMHTFDETLDIGKGVGGAPSHPDGIIDELAIWREELTAAHMLDLGKSRIKGRPLDIQINTLELYLPMDDGEVGISADGDVVRDLSRHRLGGIGDDGANNTGLTWAAERVLAYPKPPQRIIVPTVVPGAIMNQLQGPDLGANLFDGALM